LAVQERGTTNDLIMQRQPIEVRFWSKVEKRGPDECWPWTAGKNRGGYGLFGVNRKSTLAHRFAWEQLNGPIPDGMFVCHHCDNPPCCNFSHLFLGSNQENVQDSANKGRWQETHHFSGYIGEGHPQHVLTKEQVLEIRRHYETGMVTMTFLAEKFGVHIPAISRIIHRLRWKHI
jgi:hypothetical protein